MTIADPQHVLVQLPSEDESSEHGSPLLKLIDDYAAASANFYQVSDFASDEVRKPVWEKMVAARNLVEAALAQQVEQPVAWVLFRKDDDGLEPVMFYGGKEKPEGEFKDRFELHGVWTAPAAQPLSDEQIGKIESEIWNMDSMDDTERKSNREFARAIEAAHGIGADK